MLNQPVPSQKIAIIGAGFSGTALVAILNRIAERPLEIFLFDRSGTFGLGPAYSTPYPYHLLNVRAGDMSIFEDDGYHFVNWLRMNKKRLHLSDKTIPLEEQFVPRLMYGKYLQHTLQMIVQTHPSNLKLHMLANEVIDVQLERNEFNQIQLTTDENVKINVDQVILALGNQTPRAFPFPIHSTIKCIHNPWDYSLVEEIKKTDPVAIVGTGLSMIDTVLSLHHQKHRGKIIVISRHGLLPLPHAYYKLPLFPIDNELPKNLREFCRYLRREAESYIELGRDWRSLINSLREQTPFIWQSFSVKDRKRFLRHLLPYWSIHRHRVQNQIASFLKEQVEKKKMIILAGRIVETKHEKAIVCLRGSEKKIDVDMKWLVNCMGPTLHFSEINNSIIQSLNKQGIIRFDSLNLGLETNEHGSLIDSKGKSSLEFFALGPLRKAMLWETNSVPEIRKQCLQLANLLLNLYGETYGSDRKICR